MYENNTLTITLQTTAAVTANTMVSAAGNYSGLLCLVAMGDALSNETVAAVAAGAFPIIAAGTISAGDEVEADATGKVLTLGTGKRVGVALTSASVGQKCVVLLK